MSPRAVIFGCAGTSLSADERRLFANADPWGFILFARNVAEPEQLRRLTSEMRAAIGRNAPVLVDQEGGRVERLTAPAWRAWRPALDECQRLPDTALRVQAMRLRCRLIGRELRAVGIDVNCAPVLDLVHPDTHPVLRNRCYGGDPAEVAAIGRGVAEGLLAEGVLPIMKHMPGLGRAALDSHKDLPRTEAGRDLLEADFAPFRALHDLPMGMVAHLVFAALDSEAPASQSPAILSMIRDGLGFDGLLMTDDLSMSALQGPMGARASRALDAGCDVILHCNGDMAEMTAVVEAVPHLAGDALARAERALAGRAVQTEADVAPLEHELAELERRAGHA